MAATASFTAQELKLCRSLLSCHWRGCWSLRRDNHEAVLRLNGHELAILDLFGTSAKRHTTGSAVKHTCCGSRRPRPPRLTVMGCAARRLLGGADESRLETRRHVALVSSNYGDEDQWAWTRFEGNPPQVGTASVRIRPGESASDEDRQRWATQLANRPDLLGASGGVPR